MSRELTDPTEIWWDWYATTMHIVGHAAAYEDAAEKARASAGDWFARGRDSEARQWREFAEWLERLGIAQREKQARHNAEEPPKPEPIDTEPQTCAVCGGSLYHEHEPQDQEGP